MTKVLALTLTLLSLALAGNATAETPVAGIDLGAKSSESTIDPAAFYQYRQFWVGNCFYRTIYVTNGYAWRYRYAYRCY